MLSLIGVPFDGWGRRAAQAAAAAALRTAGIERALPSEVMAEPEFVLPEPTSARAAGSGLMNEPALLAMIDAVHDRVDGALRAGRFPFVYGADCCVLLGAVPALRDATGVAGLVFVDGHEDTTSLDASQDGEVANMEVGLLLGLTGQLAPDALRRRLPALRSDALAMLGPNDGALRRELNVASLADRGVLHRTAEEVAADPASHARQAVAQVASHAPGWWLHVDLDVLAQTELVAQRVPGDADQAGGLSWSQLTELVASALGAGGCRGFSLVIYDPDQDPDRSEARRIVQFVADIAAFLPASPQPLRP